MTRKVEFMDFHAFKRMIGKLFPSNGPVYLHLLGEPLMHPQLGEMIRYGESQGYEIGLFTNGSLLTEEISNDILDSGLDLLTISYEMCEQTFKHLRKGGDFDLVRQNVLQFLVMRDSRKTRKPFVQISSIVLQDELEMDGPILETGVDDITFKRIHDWTGDLEDITSMAGMSETGPERICLAPWTTMSVLVDGRVVPCCEDYDGKYVLGDLNKDSLSSIWNGKEMSRLRKALLKRRKGDIELCKDCTHGPNDKGIPRERLFLLSRLVKLLSHSVRLGRT
jgi:radical SAM protein with 4Fe4S-binding SPASM domain